MTSASPIVVKRDRLYNMRSDVRRQAKDVINAQKPIPAAIAKFCNKQELSQMTLVIAEEVVKTNHDAAALDVLIHRHFNADWKRVCGDGVPSMIKRRVILAKGQNQDNKKEKDKSKEKPKEKEQEKQNEKQLDVAVGGKRKHEEPPQIFSDEDVSAVSLSAESVSAESVSAESVSAESLCDDPNDLNYAPSSSSSSEDTESEEQPPAKKAEEQPPAKKAKVIAAPTPLVPKPLVPLPPLTNRFEDWKSYLNSLSTLVNTGKTKLQTRQNENKALELRVVEAIKTEVAKGTKELERLKQEQEKESNRTKHLSGLLSTFKKP